MSKNKLGLSTKIFIALLLGAITGIILHYTIADTAFTDFLVNGVFYVLGNAFLQGMQMLVVPLVFFSLICGSMAIGDTKSLGKVGIKAICFYLVTTAIAISIALGVANLTNPGLNLDMSSVAISETTVSTSQSVATTLLNIIPTNPVQSLAQGSMLQIIFFSILLGITLAKLGEKTSTIANFCEQGNMIMMEMTLIIMKAAPIGVFCLIAKTFVELGFDAFGPMLKYMLTVILVLAIQCFVVYMLMLKIFANYSPAKFLKRFAPVMGFAFSTATSNATIPLSIDTLSKKIGVSKKISSFTIPLGATINMDGTAIMQGVAVIFIAQAFGIQLGVTEFLTVIFTATMASVGTAGVPGVGLITLSMVLSSVGLPIEGIAIIMGIDRILDMTRTAVNITGDAVCTTIIATQEGAIQEIDDDYDFDENVATA